MRLCLPRADRSVPVTGSVSTQSQVSTCSWLASLWAVFGEGESYAPRSLYWLSTDITLIVSMLDCINFNTHLLTFRPLYVKDWTYFTYLTWLVQPVLNIKLGSPFLLWLSKAHIEWWRSKPTHPLNSSGSFLVGREAYKTIPSGMAMFISCYHGASDVAILGESFLKLLFIVHKHS